MNEKLSNLVGTSGLYPPRGIEIYRRPKVEAITGFSSSTMYLAIAEGRFPPGISLGARAVGWIDVEVRLRNMGVAAGISDSEMRELVAWMIEQRSSAVAA